MTDISHQQHSQAASATGSASATGAIGATGALSSRGQADAQFLRRVLFGLIAATIFSGAVTVALTSHHETEGLQVASTHGPA